MKLLLLVLCGLISQAICFQSSPAVIFSHSLVPGISLKLASPKPVPFSLDEVTSVANELVGHCSSNVYVLVSHPGLTLQDLANKHHWPALRQAMSLSSTLLTFPHTRGVLDLDALEKTIIERCSAETITYNGDSWVDFKQHEFIDSRKRVVRLTFPPLPTDPKERIEALLVRDTTLGMMLKRMPSPYHSVVYVSDTAQNVHPMPPAYQKSQPEKYEIFADLSQHPSRLHEVERNNHFGKIEPQWNQPRHNVLMKSDNEKEEGGLAIESLAIVSDRAKVWSSLVVLDTQLSGLDPMEL
ncbi:hypothetical protein BABINDRAFT_165084 [Babjeviella inositovora NRRL Y-12698]|uniref:Protein BIG1 n=1 Tax=Babjeviella inositovora NRRL Y-12698 TaxID=984486 RepID=A0A1E3QWU0_9ASCO|nr:uncharacterized protein BABINDRAFT_165084 [Babjeviella inositovora NRRL Y-12698]ODQ81542.1 hypothetical protein BABINDRAFT_165084 [Babjeviella inositovora NRRL Y-12698]